MGVEQESYVFGQGVEITKKQLVNAVRNRMFRMFQNEPHVVDSLFNQHIRPRIMEADYGGDFEEETKTFAKDAYIRLNRHFRQPRPRLKLGTEEQARYNTELIPLPYPDSLFNEGIAGKVGLQLYLNPEGEPLAIEVLEPVHPTLDAIAMQAAVRQRWHPVYLHGEAIHGWALYNISFKAPSAG